MSTEQCKKILASVAALSKCAIILTGGEPMEREDIYELIQYGRELGLKMLLATCGYLLNDESIVKLKQAGVSALSFSLDGASAETHDAFREAQGAFNDTVRAAEVARRAGMRFQINSTISKINIDEVVAIAELAKQLGAYCFNPFVFVPTGRGGEIPDVILEPLEYERLLNELLWVKLNSGIEVRVTCGPQFARVCRQDKLACLTDGANGCMGGKEFGFISYRGDVQTCGFLNVSTGNLIENDFDFEKIWLGSEFLKEIRDRSSYTGKCRVCEYIGLCGGCRARAYTTSGDYLGTDPVCGYQGEVKTDSRAR